MTSPYAKTIVFWAGFILAILTPVADFVPGNYVKLFQAIIVALTGVMVYLVPNTPPGRIQ